LGEDVLIINAFFAGLSHDGSQAGCCFLPFPVLPFLGKKTGKIARFFLNHFLKKML